MSESWEIAQGALLSPGGVTVRHLESVLGELQAHAIDLGEVYLERTVAESWMLEDGIVKEGDLSIQQGAGLRVLSADRTAYASVDAIETATLREAARTVRAIAASGTQATIALPAPAAVAPLYSQANPGSGLSDADKIALLNSVDSHARRLDAHVRQVIVNLTASHRIMLVVATDGTCAADVRPLVRLNVSVVAERNGRRETGSDGGGARTDLGYFVAQHRAEAIAAEAVRQALVNLDAEPAPAGTMPVVLGPGWPGILLHEAIGHGLEGDFNRKGTSAFSGRLGSQVAAPAVTVVDDGTLAGRRGSLSIDDEGTPSGRTVLIDHGMLRGYLQDKLNARLMGMNPTGNGRRESYRHRPLPRMTNTFMLAGAHDPQAILASVDRGLYAVNFGGGQVDITSGKFVFSAAEAYLIENGKVTRPVKGATLIGDGPSVLTRVSLVGNDLSLDRGVGTCGKDGQSVPVGVGLPTIRVDALTVGGTRTGSP